MFSPFLPCCIDKFGTEYLINDQQHYANTTIPRFTQPPLAQRQQKKKRWF
jgi:hypothetical protein